MIGTDTFQRELEDWQARFYSYESYPRKSFTITLLSHRLVIQYERKGVPSVYAMRQTARERTYFDEELISPDIFIGRSLRGMALARFYIGRVIEMKLHLAWVAVAAVSSVFGFLTGNSRREIRARTFAESLLTHWEAFEPVSPPPEDITAVTSPDRRITVVYDPELGNRNSPPVHPFDINLYWVHYYAGNRY